jgi:hypothetical protein
MRYYCTITALGTVGIYNPIVGSGFFESDKSLEEVTEIIEQHHKKLGHNYKVVVGICPSNDSNSTQ